MDRVPVLLGGVVVSAVSVLSSVLPVTDWVTLSALEHHKLIVSSLFSVPECLMLGCKFLTHARSSVRRYRQVGILRYANEEVGVVIDQDQGVAYMEADPFASPGNLERGLDFLEEHGYCLEPEESYDPYAEPESNSLGWDRHYALPKAEWNA